MLYPRLSSAEISFVKDCGNKTIPITIFKNLAPTGLNSLKKKKKNNKVFMVLNLNRRLSPHPVAWESAHQPSDVLHMHSVCANKLDFKWAGRIRSERCVKFPWIEINKGCGLTEDGLLYQAWTRGMMEDSASLTSYETCSMCNTSTVPLWYTWVDLLTGYKSSFCNSKYNIFYQNFWT